jgi:hypothetical protein
MAYHKRPDKIGDPGPLLGVMRPCRKAMIDAQSGVKPFGTMYHGLGMVVSAIDALAMLLIGREGYFWHQGSSPASDGALKREAAERAAEAGLEPWPEASPAAIPPKAEG